MVGSFFYEVPRSSCTTLSSLNPYVASPVVSDTSCVPREYYLICPCLSKHFSEIKHAVRNTLETELLPDIVSVVLSYMDLVPRPVPVPRPMPLLSPFAPIDDRSETFGDYVGWERLVVLPGLGMTG